MSEKITASEPTKMSEGAREVPESLLKIEQTAKKHKIFRNNAETNKLIDRARTGDWGATDDLFYSKLWIVYAMADRLSKTAEEYQENLSLGFEQLAAVVDSLTKDDSGQEIDAEKLYFLIYRAVSRSMGKKGGENGHTEELPIGASDTTPYGEQISDPEYEVLRHIADDELMKVLGNLREREREVIEKRFFKGMTFDAIGNSMGISLERVRQIESKALNKLRHPSRSGSIKNYLYEFDTGSQEAKEMLAFMSDKDFLDVLLRWNVNFDNYLTPGELVLFGDYYEYLQRHPSLPAYYEGYGDAKKLMHKLRNIF